MSSKTISNKPKATAKPTKHAAQFIIGMRVYDVSAPIYLAGEIVALTPDNASAHVKWDSGISGDCETIHLAPVSGRKSVSRETPATGEAETQFIEVREDQIVANPYQPRTIFDAGELQSLADSISEHGILQAPVVRESPDEWFVEPGKSGKEEGFFVLNRAWLKPDKEHPGWGNLYQSTNGVNQPFGTHYKTEAEAQATLPRYELIAGERRVRAARLAGKKTIKVVLREASNEEMSDLAIVENRDRAPINIIEEARAYKRRVDEFGMSVKDVGEKAGKSRSVISNAMRLLELPESVQLLLAENKLSVAHGRALAAWKEWPRFVEFYAQQIVEANIPAKYVELGFAEVRIPWQKRNAAQEADIYVDSSFGWPYSNVCDIWLQEHPSVFVQKSVLPNDGYSERYREFICLDVDLLDRLKAEYDAAKEPERQRDTPSKSTEELQAEAKAERQKTIAKNKARRAALTQIGSDIQVKIANSDGIKHGEYASAGKVEHALLAEIIVNALSPYAYRPIIEKVGQLHGLDAKWIEKFNGSYHWRELLDQLAAEKGLAWMVAFWGEVLLVQSITHATKDALELPTDCKYFATTIGIEIPEAAK